jgi:hypothetical protein
MASGYKYKVKWEELLVKGFCEGLYVDKYIKCISSKEAFKLASILNSDYNVRNIEMEKINA